MLGRDGYRPDEAAKRQRTGVAHENRRRRRVEPEKTETGSDHRPEHDGEFSRAGHEMNLKVVGKHRISRKIGDDAKCGCGDHDRHDGEAVKAVGEVYRIAGTDHDDAGEGDEKPSQIDDKILEKRKCHGSRKRRFAIPDNDPCRHRGNKEFRQQARLAGKSLVRPFRDLQIVVAKSDRAEAEGHHQDHPDVDIRQIGPQQARNDDPGENHQSAHCRRSGFLEVGLRAVRPDRLSASLADTKGIDDHGSAHEHDQHRGDQRAAGSERDVPEHIQDRQLISKFNQHYKHVKPCPPLPVRRPTRTSRSASAAPRESARLPSPGADNFLPAHRQSLKIRFRSMI